MTEAFASRAKRAWDYGVAVLAAFLGVLVRAALDPVLDGGDQAFIVPLVAVVAVAWYGLGPALVALALSMTAVVYLFVDPRQSFAVARFPDQLAVGLFLFAGVGCAALGEAQRRGRRRTATALRSALFERAELEAEVAQRERAEEALRESETRFRALADNMSQFAWMTDARGWIFWYNRRWFEYTGTTLEEMQGWGWRKVHHPDHVDRVVEKIAGCFRTGEPWEDTFPLRGTDGTYRWFLSRALPIRDEAGAVVRWFGTNTDVTDQRNAEQAARESEARFRALADSIPQLAWMTRPDGHIFWYNRRWYDYTGTTLEQMDGWGWEAVHDPAELPRVAAKWRAALAAGGPWEDTFPLRRHDGAMRWHLSQARPVRDEAGAIALWFGTNTDIDDRKRAEEVLAERTKLTALRADVGVALGGDDPIPAVLRRCTEAVVRHLGAAFARVWTLNEADQVLELRASAGLYTHTDGPHARVRVGDFKIGRIAASRTPHLTNDVPTDPNVSDPEWAKREGMVAFAGYPLLLGERVLGVAALFARHPLSADALADLGPLFEGVAQYIDRKRVQDALRNSEARFRLLTETIPQVVWNADAGGHATYFNARWTEHTGIPVAAAVARGWLAAVHPDDAPRVDDAWRATVARGSGTFAHELRLRRAADGAYRWFLTVAVLLHRADGTVDQWIGSMADIHDQKEHAAVLEAKVADRTAALTATADELTRSNGELEKFAYVASHDLQEPLRKIQAFGDRLGTKFKDKLDEQGRDYLDRMQASAGRMRQLINDLLAFSRVTTKTQPFGRVDLNRSAADAVDDLHDRLQQTGGAVDIGPLPTIDADPTQVRQLMQNLIGNGLKFHKPGEPPRVTVRAEAAREPGPDGGPPRAVCRLTVSDDGIGFDEKYLDRIFQVFQRLHGRGEYDGTGVGLAICRKIVDRHGGAITARSSPGRGATFVVTLPLRHPTRGATP